MSWWNSHVKTMGISTAYVISQYELKRLMIKEYCPIEEMQKLEQEFWNLVIQNANIATYTNYFNDLSIFFPNLVTPQHKKVERYIQGLVQPIQGLVTSSRPTMYDGAKRLAINPTDQEICQGTMVQKVYFLKCGNKKRMSDDDSEQPTRRKQELGNVYLATIP